MQHPIVTNVREANQWLKRAGVTQLKFSSKQDQMYGKVFELKQQLGNGSWVTLVSSPGLGECVEHAHHYFSIPYC